MSNGKIGVALRSGRTGIGGVLLILFALVGCDLSVTNPGPTASERLDDEGAHISVVNGARLLTARALGDLAYIGSEPAREVTTAGRVFPQKLPVQSGVLTGDDHNRQWNLPHQARWMAEDAVRRFENLMDDPDGYDLTSQALKLAGFANRLLGENMCFAVIDGGPSEPHDVHFQRAEVAFTRAIQSAERTGQPDVARASLAGRAQVRLLLGDYQGAASDASQIPTDFVHNARYSDETLDQRNIVYWTNDNVPYRAHSAWDTPWEEYYETTGDPRVRWGTDPDSPVGEFESVPWYFQLKYTGYDSSIPLASGREMRLIEAEAALRDGNLQGAMSLMNGVRVTFTSDLTGEALDPLVATSAAEAWTHLKRERGAELWLEARRLGDLRRWVEGGTPGDFEDMTDRSLCFPIQQTERQTNPNIPL
jgi:starch-binding outer membrane protein, SusD/RagB family